MSFWLDDTSARGKHIQFASLCHIQYGCSVDVLGVFVYVMEISNICWNVGGNQGNWTCKLHTGSWDSKTGCQNCEVVQVGGLIWFQSIFYPCLFLWVNKGNFSLWVSYYGIRCKEVSCRIRHLVFSNQLKTCFTFLIAITFLWSLPRSLHYFIHQRSYHKSSILICQRELNIVKSIQSCQKNVPGKSSVMDIIFIIPYEVVFSLELFSVAALSSFIFRLPFSYDCHLTLDFKVDV